MFFELHLVYHLFFFFYRLRYFRKIFRTPCVNKYLMHKSKLVHLYVTNLLGVTARRRQPFEWLVVYRLYTVLTTLGSIITLFIPNAIVCVLNKPFGNHVHFDRNSIGKKCSPFLKHAAVGKWSLSVVHQWAACSFTKATVVGQYVLLFRI